MADAAHKKGVLEELGWEGAWSLMSLISLTLFQFVPAFNSIGALRVACGLNGFACGAVLAFLYFSEIGDGRTWPGGILPLAFAGWGLSLVV